MIWISLLIGCAVLTAVIAAAKNKNVMSWFFLGLVFGLFATVAVIFSPAVATVTKTANIGNTYRYHTQEEELQGDTGDLFDTIAIGFGLLVGTGALIGIAMAVFL